MSESKKFRHEKVNEDSIGVPTLSPTLNVRGNVEVWRWMTRRKMKTQKTGWGWGRGPFGSVESMEKSVAPTQKGRDGVISDEEEDERQKFCQDFKDQMITEERSNIIDLHKRVEK